MVALRQWLRRDSKNDLEVEDFVFALKVLGVSARFEDIRYTGQENNKDIHDSTSKKKVIDIEQSNIPIDINSSYDTIVDSSSSDSSDDSRDNSDGEDDMSVCSDAIVPVFSPIEDQLVAEVGAGQDLSTEIADENGLPTVFSQVQDFDSEKATGSCSPLNSLKMSPAESSSPGGTSSPSVTSCQAVTYSLAITSSSAVSYSSSVISSPSVTSSPAPITLPVPATNKSPSPSFSAAVTGAMATVTMVSTDHSRREGGRRM